MKKKILLILIIMMMVLLSQNVIASESDVGGTNEVLSSSDSITDTLREQLKCSSEDSVILLYNIPQRETATYYSIRAYLCDSVRYAKVYMVTDSKGDVTYRGFNTENNELYISSDGEMFAVNETTVERLNNYQTIITNIIPDVVINDVYFLNGQTGRTGISIIYETTVGDFVYHFYDKDIQMGKGEHFFTWAAFCETQLAIIEKQKEEMSKQGALLFGGSDFDITNYLDLSIYDMTSASFAPLSNAGNINVNQNDDKSDNNMDIDQNDNKLDNNIDIDQNDNRLDNNGVVNQGVTNNSNNSSQSIETQNPTNMFWWIGVPCVVILMTVGLILGYKKIQNRRP